MPETVPLELRILIERVVRPLPVPLSRQKRLRTELLQHLLVIYSEEQARNEAPTGALNRTAQRFGNPTELMAELRETVTEWEMCASWWEAFWAQRRHESNGQYVTRIVCRFASYLCLMAGIGMLDRHVFGTVPFSITELTASSAAIAFLSLWLGGFLLFAFKASEKWTRLQRPWNQIALLSLPLITAWPLSTIALMQIAGGRWSDYAAPIVSSIGCGIGSSIVGIYLGTIHRRDTNYREDWAELNLDAS